MPTLMRFLLIVALAVVVGLACASRSSVGRRTRLACRVPYRPRRPGARRSRGKAREKRRRRSRSSATHHSPCEHCGPSTPMPHCRGRWSVRSSSRAAAGSVTSVSATRSTRWIFTRGGTPVERPRRALAASDDALFAPTDDPKNPATHAVLVLSAADGRRITALPDAVGENILHGISPR
jgi:hypothetical protein